MPTPLNLHGETDMNPASVRRVQPVPRKGLGVGFFLCYGFGFPLKYGSLSAHRFALEFDLVGVVCQAVEDGLDRHWLVTMVSLRSQRSSTISSSSRCSSVVSSEMSRSYTTSTSHLPMGAIGL